MIDEMKLSVELLKRRLPQWKAANLAGFPPSTFSDYLRGARPPPSDFQAKVEAALGLPAESLTKDVPSSGSAA